MVYPPPVNANTPTTNGAGAFHLASNDDKASSLANASAKVPKSSTVKLPRSGTHHTAAVPTNRPAIAQTSVDAQQAPKTASAARRQTAFQAPTDAREPVLRAIVLPPTVPSAKTGTGAITPEQASAKLKAWLDAGSYHTHTSLVAAANFLATLPDDVAQKAVALLPAGYVAKWCNEAESWAPSYFGGLSHNGEMASWLSVLTKLSGPQQAQFDDHHDDQLVLANAIANRAPADVKMAFLKEIAPDALQAQLRDVPGNTIERGKTAGKAIATVLATLPTNDASGGDLFKQAWQSLTPAQRTSVMNTAAGQDYLPNYGGGGGTFIYEPKQLVSLLSTASRSSDPELKAQVFNEAAKVLKDIAQPDFPLNPRIERKRDMGIVANAMSNLIKSDYTGILGKLALQVDPEGSGLTGYCAALVELDRSSEIGTLISHQQLGNGLNEDPVKRFATPVTGDDGKPFDQVPFVLGYVVSCGVGGVQKVADNADAQAKALVDIFGTGLGIGNVPGPYASGLKYVAGVLAQAYSEDVRNHSKDLKTAFWDLARPRTGNHVYEGQALVAYYAAEARTTSVNR